MFLNISLHLRRYALQLCENGHVTDLLWWTITRKPNVLCHHGNICLLVIWTPFIQWHVAQQTLHVANASLRLCFSIVHHNADFILICFGIIGPIMAAITKTFLVKYTEKFTTKKWILLDEKNLIFFHISAQNIDCGYSLEPPRRGGSNEYPPSMFLSRNKKNNVYPCKPQF